jgi:DNA-directed RNA polymerase specialized sigma24 family protein
MTTSVSSSDSQIRSIALFYLFSFMDEKAALDASHRTIAHLKAVRGHDENREHTSDVDGVQLIRLLSKTYKQHRKHLARNKAATPMPMETAWQFPVGFDLSIWAKFQKDSNETEVIAVLLSKVLGFSDAIIAEGLNVSTGTARYRIGKGIRQLGSVTQKSDTQRTART